MFWPGRLALSTLLSVCSMLGSAVSAALFRDSHFTAPSVCGSDFLSDLCVPRAWVYLPEADKEGRAKKKKKKKEEEEEEEEEE